MAAHYSVSDLKNMDKNEMILLVLSMQEQMEKLNETMENILEQLRIANHQTYGRRSEKLNVMTDQLSFFNEAEVLSEEAEEELPADQILPDPHKRKKQKGKREEDLKDFPVEPHLHTVSEQKLDEFYGKNNWRQLPDEVYKRLRYEPASWTVEVHTVQVFVGKDGDHQDEFTRGDRPKDLLRNSIATPSLVSAIMTAKYVNAAPIARIEQEFDRNGLNLSRQTMGDWVIKCAERYFKPMYDHLTKELLSYPVTQCDETPLQVTEEERSKCYMWVHRTGEFYEDHPVVLYEYQRGRSHEIPQEFYKNYKGILVTDGLQQYHIVADHLPNLISANCWAHARRDFSDALKAIGKEHPEAQRQSIAYEALQRIGAFYNLEKEMKDLSSGERQKLRQKESKPLLEAYFAWVKETLNGPVLPKGKTAQGLKYSLNQEKYLRVFLENGDVPIDNSASERAIRPFCIGKKNWVLMDSIKGAQASAIVYSIAETAKANNLNPYYYFKHLLEVIPTIQNAEGNVDPGELDRLLPWSKDLPKICQKQRR